MLSQVTDSCFGNHMNKLKLHESLPGEVIAMGWHFVWAVLSLSTLCICAATIYFLSPAQRALALVLRGQVILSAGAVLWHLFGAFEHWRDVKRLSA